jgi:tRNA(Ile)-lysidine synthase
MARAHGEPGRRLTAADCPSQPAIADLLARCDFPPPGAAVTCAVSGGADSLALFVLAVEARCAVTAVHVDHGLREGSAAEADLVAQVAAKCGAEFRAVRVEVAPGPNLEARARAARYAVLPDDVCTGHTADDLAETVLLNLLRGGGMPGMASLRRGPRHPILGLRRSETRALCAELGLEPLDDPMNDDPRFARVRVRHELLPLLDDIAGRDVVPLLARQSELSADLVDAVDALVAGLDPTDVRALAEAPVALARWALRRWIRSTTGSEHPVDAASLDRALRVVRGEVKATEIDGWRLARTAGRLRLERVAREQSN